MPSGFALAVQYGGRQRILFESPGKAKRKVDAFVTFVQVELVHHRKKE
jgi:hypothetical protein